MGVCDQGAIKLSTKKKDTLFHPKQRCQVISVHHRVFESNIGKYVIVTQVFPDTRQVLAHDDAPVKYRKNRKGVRVVAYDPRCVQSYYGYDQLRVDTQCREKRDE